MNNSPNKKVVEKSPTHEVRGLFTRALVLRLLREVYGGKRLEDALSHIQGQRWAAEDIAFARLLLMQCLRFSWAAEACFSPHTKRKPSLQDRLILTIAAVSLIWLMKPARVVLSIVTALAAPKSRGFIHAITQRMCEDWQFLGKDQQQDKLQALLLGNAPRWSIQRWQKDWSDEAENLLIGHARTPMLDLCFKDHTTARKTAIDWQAAQPLDRLVRHQGNPSTLEGYDQGDFWVQDLAAQLPVWLVRSQLEGKHVLDMCAAPGGKTAQLLSYGAKVTALDQDARRIGRMKDNMQRLRYSPEIIVQRAEDFQPETRFPMVLLDAPCSATGTVRRHPDILMRDHNPALRVQQIRLMQCAVEMLEAGGILVYAVCSVNRSEGWDFVPKLAQEMRLTPWPFVVADRAVLSSLIPAHRIGDNLLQTLPNDAADIGGMDGFFVAIYQKN